MIKHIYIHIPFCKYICSYCDFCKKYIKNQPVSEYLRALESEINMTITDKIEIETLYIGGGTPSALEIENLKQLQQIIAKFFVFKPDYEFTFECNPDDINDEKMQILKQMGVNRLSIGVQIVNDTILQKLQRKHTTSDVEIGLEISKKYFNNISCDFIFNLPEQTKIDLDNSLRIISQYNLSHVSYYGLILEENTILDTQIYQLQDEATEANWYHYLQKALIELGYFQYEISNYARGEQNVSKHNLAYWQQHEYYGFGLGASAYVNGTRITNTKSMQDYLQNPLTRLCHDTITKEDELEEKILLNLRTRYGIEQTFMDKYCLDYQNDYFEVINQNVRIKSEYLYLSNEIIVDLLIELERNVCKDIS